MKTINFIKKPITKILSIILLAVLLFSSTLFVNIGCSLRLSNIERLEQQLGIELPDDTEVLFFRWTRSIWGITIFAILEFESEPTSLLNNEYFNFYDSLENEPSDTHKRLSHLSSSSYFRREINQSATSIEYRYPRGYFNPNFYEHFLWANERLMTLTYFSETKVLFFHLIA